MKKLPVLAFRNIALFEANDVASLQFNQPRNESNEIVSLKQRLFLLITSIAFSKYCMWVYYTYILVLSIT